jgi:nucleotide-binding universal stress UspA family protein
VHEVVVSDRFVVPGLEVLADEFAEPAVCMSTRGHFDLGYWLFGSTAAELLSEAQIPMVFVGPEVDTEDPQGLDTVLICTDGSDCAEAIVPTAADWIRAMSLRPKVVEVLDPQIRFELEATEGDVIETSTVHGVADHVATVSGVSVDWDVLHGDDAAKAIVEHARSSQASLIAMATHGRTGWARIAAGSVATAVVHSSPCPVLLVRPTGAQLNPQVEIDERVASA